MTNDTNARWGALGGVLSVIAFIVGFGLITSSAPGYNGSAQDWAGYISDHATRIHIGLVIVSGGIFLFIWFLGSLRGAIAAAEGGTHRLASIAFGSGLVSAALLLVGFTAIAAAAFRPEFNADLTRVFNDFGALSGAPAAAPLTAFSAATAIAGYRHGALPAPAAGFSALSAITQPLAFGVIFTTTGVFAADGVFGAIIPVITFSLAVIAASWALFRGYTPPQGSAQ